MRKPVEGWIVLQGIREAGGNLDVYRTEKEAESSAEYDRNHGYKNAAVFPCLIII